MEEEIKNHESTAGNRGKYSSPNISKKDGTSHRKRKVLLPPKQGTVSRAVIRKAVRKIIANRLVINET